MTEGSPAERFDNAPPAATRPAGSDTPEQHSIGRSVVLHLLPGALITLFFINGRRQYGAYDIDTLTAAVKTAKAQAKLDVPDRPRPGRRQAG
jgi:hypothetical protein